MLGLAFNRNVSFDGIFYAPFTLVGSDDRTNSVLTVPSFNPLSFINAPAGATHFRLINSVSVISDFAYNDKSGIYEAVNSNLNEVSDIEYSPYLSLTEVQKADTVVTATLPGTPTMTKDVSVINCIGIEFYQQVNDNYYLFNSGNALKIQAIF